MNALRAYATRAFTLSVTLFYGALMAAATLVQIVKHRRKFFQVKKRVKTPQCLLDPNLGKHDFVQLKEVKLHYVANGNNNKNMMLLLHGFPDFWYTWRSQLKEFAKDYWVVAPDMRGYGESEKPAGIENYSLVKLVDDVKELILSLGKDKVILVAHDWGGAIAWSFAAKYPEMVEKLIILNAPHPKHFGEVLRSSWKQFFMSWYIFFFQIPLMPELVLLGNDLNVFNTAFRSASGKCILSNEELEAYKFIFSKPGGLTGPLNYYRASFSSLTTKTKSMPYKITPPTLVIWGQKDTALAPVLGTGCSKYVDNFNFRLIEDASHWVHIEQPALVNKHMKDFLARP